MCSIRHEKFADKRRLGCSAQLSTHTVSSHVQVWISSRTRMWDRMYWYAVCVCGCDLCFIVLLWVHEPSMPSYLYYLCSAFSSSVPHGLVCFSAGKIRNIKDKNNLRSPKAFVTTNYWWWEWVMLPLWLFSLTSGVSLIVFVMANRNLLFSPEMGASSYVSDS